MRAMIKNSQPEYLIHEDGTVTKFIFGVEEVSERNFCIIVGKIKPKKMPKNLDDDAYNGYSPLECVLVESEKKGFYRLEV